MHIGVYYQVFHSHCAAVGDPTDYHRIVIIKENTDCGTYQFVEVDMSTSFQDKSPVVTFS